MTTIKKRKLKRQVEDKKEESPYGASNLRSRLDVPSRRWDKVNPDAIGEGFQPVDLDEFDEVPEKPKGKNIKLGFKKFKNRFVIGKSRFISYDARKVVVKVKDNSKRRAPINASAKVTKPQRKAFGKALDSNIKNWVKIFMDEVLPVTLSVQSAAEEVKDRVSQLVDAQVAIPDEYVTAKLYQAAQLRIIREVTKVMKLSPDEAKLLLPEFQLLKPFK